MKARVYKPEEIIALKEQGRFFRSNITRNRRKAICRFCGKVVQKGDGIDWYKFAPNNNWFFNTIYICVECDAIWKVGLGIFNNPTLRFELWDS